ncbi:SusC/RagA family TonB-linked outer membrane protein [Parachryseolinea silvisoli]|uniref:SusC/RagA family TonB-linked outer membrane protein n=1 Tax=Parachryseolinea silvisoli TaxID=2873601 RepID=UPI002265B8DE|nr:SusC/RagA family TonB-linked outer membrane protein [Parachryseolinea silvisoli]MCD9017644.1 SusC/RagA family TonB-linked outer membrane protein [Parachryseolinea silvisoli]
MLKHYLIVLIGALCIVCPHTSALGSGSRVAGSFLPLPQQQTIRGTVTDENGVVFPGVNVVVQGTGIGTVTSSEGMYSLDIPAGATTLVFSFVGYIAQPVPIDGKTTIDVALAPDVASLGEVVITALGIQKESKKLGYAVETVQLDALQKNRTVNVGESLEGKVAGLDISPPSSGAGASTKIRLRGQSGFAGANNSPLIVINGLPMDQGAQSANGNDSRDRGDNLQIVSPDDIESMTVLKGATAAALYGSRAANGAVIITTKSGRNSHGIGVELNSNYTLGRVMDFTDFQHEFGQGQLGNRPTTQGNAVSTGMLGWGARLDGEPTINFDGQMRPYTANPNRIKEFFRDARTFANTVAVSGGGANGNFRLSYSKTDAEGITPDNTYSKDIANLGLQQNVTDRLSVTANINFSHEINKNPPQVGVQGPGAANFLYRMSTSVPLSALEENAVAPNGTETPTSGFQTTLINPYFQMGRQFFKNKKDRFLGTATVRYKLTDWLFIQGRYNYDYGVGLTEYNTPTGMGTSTPYNSAGTAFNGTYDANDAQGTQVNTDFLLGANKEFGNFSVDASVGGNIFKRSNRTANLSVREFTIRDVYSFANGVIKTNVDDTRLTDYTISRDQVNSLYGLLELGYKGMLYLNITGRQDWFSVLNPENNSEFYPSVSGSFVFSEILPDAEWLSYGKLRGSWARVGSANGVSPYEGTLLYGLVQNQFNGQTLGTIPSTTSPNRSLTPFTVTEKELGLEARLFNSKVRLDIAAYEKVTTDQILNVQVSNASGYLDTKRNIGSLQNRGMELMVEVVPVQYTNFKWTTSFNTALNTTEVLALAPGVNRFTVQSFSGNEFIGSLVYEVGLPLNQLSARTYQRNENGQIVVNDNGTLIATAQNVNFGSALPKWTGGWVNTLSYKNLSLMVHVDFKAGGKILSSTALNGLRQGHTKASLVGRREGETGVVFDAVYANGERNTSAVNPQDFYTGYRNAQIADPFIFKSDFVKLRNIMLSYDLTSWVKSRVKFIQGLALSASCRNVAILYKDLADLDPEAFASSGDNRVGYEQTSLPTTRNYSINLNVKF